MNSYTIYNLLFSILQFLQLCSLSFSKCEERIERKTEELKESETKADEAERKANALESRNRSDDEKIETLEDQLKVFMILRYLSVLNVSLF